MEEDLVKAQLEESKTTIRNLEAKLSKPNRRRLPDECESITHKVTIGTRDIYITAATYPSGELGNIFLRIGKEGSEDNIHGALTRAISISLQYGVPLEEFIEEFEFQCMGTGGPTSNPEIPMVKSILDYLARWLRVKFLPEDSSE